MCRPFSWGQLFWSSCGGAVWGEHPDDLIPSPAGSRALIDGLPPAAAFAAWEFISGPLRLRPRVVGVPLRAPFEGTWRAHRGEYPVRYRIEEDHRRVLVLSIDHRRDAYRSATSGTAAQSARDPVDERGSPCIAQTPDRRRSGNQPVPDAGLGDEVARLGRFGFELGA